MTETGIITYPESVAGKPIRIVFDDSGRGAHGGAWEIRARQLRGDLSETQCDHMLKLVRIRRGIRRAKEPMR